MPNKAYNDKKHLKKFSKIGTNISCLALDVERQSKNPICQSGGRISFNLEQIIFLYITGFPGPTYTWYKDNQRLPVNSSQQPGFESSNFTYSTTIGTLRFSVSY